MHKIIMNKTNYTKLRLETAVISVKEIIAKDGTLRW